MTDSDKLKPEVRSALGAMVRADVCRDSVPTDAFDIIRAELLRLTTIEADALIALDCEHDWQVEHKRAEKAEAALAALKARIADGWLCGVSNDACPGNFDAAIYCLPSSFRGKRVRLVVEE